MSTEYLSFLLDVVDGWPPVGVECLPVRETPRGHEVLAAPLFVRDVSVGDVLLVERDDQERVTSFMHAFRSSHSTIWLLRTGPGVDVEQVLEEVRNVGCSTTALDRLGAYSICVPSNVAMFDVDSVLDRLPEDDLAVAFPSFRHPE